MRLTVIGLAAVVALTAPASAAWGFKYQFSTDNGVTFGSNRLVDVSNADVNLRVRVVAYADPGTIVNTATVAGPAIAFYRYGGSEKFIALNGASVGVTPLGQTAGDLTTTGTSYLSSSFSGTTPILGTTSITSFAAQLLLTGTLANFAPSFGGTPQLEWVIRTANIRVSKLGGARTIVFSNNTRITNSWYRDPPTDSISSANAGSPEGQATDIQGILTVIPAPSVLALLGLVLLGSPRRRLA
ncbi:MAG TPA: hypothetical protein VF777_08200 [Phycisphaerales bacterium]